MFEYRRPHQLWGPPTLPLNWYRGAGVKRQEREMTTHRHVGRMLRKSGTIFLLAPYTFMAWTGTTSTLPYCLITSWGKVATV